VKRRKLKLQIQNESLAICRLVRGVPIPAWAQTGSFFSITRTHDELSIVCPDKNVPPTIKAQSTGWRSLKVRGPLAFSQVGILSELSNILAQHGVSIFAISTFDTDYILVKESDLSTAVTALKNCGHEVTN
jgi:uncharacterized protein